MKRLLLSALALAAPAFLSAQPAVTHLEGVSGPVPVDKTGQTEDVRFRSEGYDRMTVPVRLSGTGPYRFLVDTGANRTAISRELAAKLRLTQGSIAELHSVTGVSAVSTATVPDLQLTRKAVKVLDAPLLESVNMGADGILGTDSLRSQRVVFDFQAQTMAIVPSTAADFVNEPGTIVIEARRRNGRLIVTDARANGHRMTIVLDTGSQISIGNAELRKQLARDGLMDALQQIELISVTGQTVTGDYMYLRDLEIGGVELRNLAVVFADAHTFKQLNLEKKPTLLLGMNAIRAFKKVSIDFANRQFRVVVPEKSELGVGWASAGN
jgi:predicted aspartyl protease